MFYLCKVQCNAFKLSHYGSLTTFSFWRTGSSRFFRICTGHNDIDIYQMENVNKLCDFHSGSVNGRVSKCCPQYWDVHSVDGKWVRCELEGKVKFQREMKSCIT